VRSVAVVTVARSDYGHLSPVLDALEADAELEPLLVVGGMHLDPAFGLTVGEIESDGRTIAARVPTSERDDSPLAAVHGMARGITGFAEAFERLRPDIVLVLGDRMEMHAAALAALPLGIPVAHVHGGESSEGAYDESLRHSITKLSHLHFAATEEYARRIVQMGEEPWRVTVSGAPALDAIATLEPVPDDELDRRVGLPLDEPTLLVTYHPETLAPDTVRRDAEELLAALAGTGHALLFTAPNVDPQGRHVLELVQRFVGEHERAVLVESLGSRAYLSVLRRVTAMVGNSSSGIIEAPSFELPVLNVGARQQGRIRAANVVDVQSGREAIDAGLALALSHGFKSGLSGLVNPYGDGHAAERIVARLRATPPGRELLVKTFHEAEA
jgi:UDP-hydrolysing UDP-N-acetyl-D-glucosamine 2-epimerase